MQSSPLPNIDADIVLSQSDLETVDILKEMQLGEEEPEALDDDDDEDGPPRNARERAARRVAASQREANDILEASQADHLAPAEALDGAPTAALTAGSRAASRAHVDLAYEGDAADDDDFEEQLFSIPQMDGGADEVFLSLLPLTTQILQWSVSHYAPCVRMPHASTHTHTVFFLCVLFSHLSSHIAKAKKHEPWREAQILLAVYRPIDSHQQQHHTYKQQHHTAQF